LLFKENDRRIAPCGGLEHNPTGAKHALTVPELGPVQGSQEDRSTETRRPVDEMDAMARKFPLSISGVFAVLPMDDPNMCFVAFSYAKPLRTFAGNALSSVAG